MLSWIRPGYVSCGRIQLLVACCHGDNGTGDIVAVMNVEGIACGYVVLSCLSVLGSGGDVAKQSIGSKLLLASLQK